LGWQLDLHPLDVQPHRQLPGVFTGLHAAAGQRWRPDQRQRQAAELALSNCADVRMGAEYGCPTAAQIARRLSRQTDLMLFDPLIGKGQARHLSFAPGLPMLQIVAGLDAETLKTIALTGPVENQLLQRRLDGTGVEQPATQRFSPASS
jgi:hypothetical protein